MKTAREIVEETIAYYSNNPRSIETVNGVFTRCFYRGKNGEVCAFSRVCLGDALLKEGEGCGCFEKEGGLDHLLKEEYKGHSVQFWEAIQTLHDSFEYWNGTTITQRAEITLI